MPKRKFSSTRKSGYKRRRTGGAMRRRVPRLLRPRNAVMNITRKFHVYSWTPGTASTNDFYRRNFTTLSAVPNNAEIVSMFDYYRIRAIKFTWIPRYNGFNGNDTTDIIPNGVTNQGQVNVILGYDKYSNTTPVGSYSQATINTMLETGRCKLLRNSNQMFSQYATPTTNEDVSQTTGNYKRAPWLNTINNLVPHYTGYIAVYDSNFSGANLPYQTYDLFITVYMQVKGLK
nr:MAG: capsid protein [Chemarfal virus 2]